MGNLIDKKTALEKLINQYTKQDIILAFSGGVDSTLLLKIACEQSKINHTNVYAYTIHTMLHPMEELELTERIAKDMGAIHKVIQVDEIKEAGIENNPVNRCYLCKKCMFGKLQEEAKKTSISIILEGTNLDDTKAYRPGIAALKELGIISPLLLAKLTKAEVRGLASLYGLSASNKPSNPCMATRFPYDTKLTNGQMQKVEQIEHLIKELGFYNVRARIHDTLVRVEVDEADIGKLVERKTELIDIIKKLGYEYVTVDLEGFRSGSQDIRIMKRPNL